MAADDVQADLERLIGLFKQIYFAHYPNRDLMTDVFFNRMLFEASHDDPARRQVGIQGIRGWMERVTPSEIQRRRGKNAKGKPKPPRRNMARDARVMEIVGQHKQKKPGSTVGELLTKVQLEFPEMNRSGLDRIIKRNS